MRIKLEVWYDAQPDELDAKDKVVNLFAEKIVRLKQENSGYALFAKERYLAFEGDVSFCDLQRTCEDYAGSSLYEGEIRIDSDDTLSSIVDKMYKLHNGMFKNWIVTQDSWHSLGAVLPKECVENKMLLGIPVVVED